MKTVKVTVEVPVGADGRALMLRLARALMREARGTEKTKNAGWGKGVLAKESEMKVKKAGRVVRTLGVNALARELGISPAHVSQVLSGKRTSRRVSEAARGRVLVVDHGRKAAV